MPIKVQCRNPACGKVLTVKDQWAGKTGKCPACGADISVPNAAGTPTDNIAAPAGGPARERVQPAPAVERRSSAPKAGLPGGQTSRREEDEEPLDVEVLDDAAPPNPVDQVSRTALVFLALGGVSVLGMALIPFLTGESLTATGRYAGSRALSGIDTSVKPELVPYLMGIPVVVALAAGLSWMLAWRGLRLGALLTAYLAAVVSGLLFLSFGGALYTESVAISKLESRTGGGVTVTLGPRIWVAAGSVGAAFVLLALATVFLHKSRWAPYVSLGVWLLLTFCGVVLVLLGS